MVYTPEERRAARCKARLKWQAKNRDRVNTYKREWRPNSAANQITERKRYKKVLSQGLHIFHKYGLTKEQHTKMVNDQGGVCAICGGPPTGRHKNLAVDHCHDSGEIRGLLCSDCNVAIGFLRDDPDRALKAAHYLKKFEVLKIKALIG